jgi:hypothetical protein
MMPTQKIPKHGWVQELGDAEAKAKRSRTAGAQLRLAIAAYKLRDFKKLKTAANLGLALHPSDDEKELLKEYVERSKEQKARKVELSILEELMHEPGSHCDALVVFSSALCPFTNLNIIQFAATIGDVTLIEEVVALGAALDFPVLDENAPDVPPSPAPPGSTALLLACASLAMYGDKMHRFPNMRRMMPAGLLDSIDAGCECAIRLVYLGANCQVKLQIPAENPNSPVHDHDPVKAFRISELDGMTAQELAIKSRQPELIRAMEVMQKMENIHLTQCRCGSRLPWNQCHGAPVPGQSNLYIEADNGPLCWRYSPKALCPCKVTNNEHYKCCWFTSTPNYKNDTNGALVHAQHMFNRTATQTLLRLQQSRIFQIFDSVKIPQGSTTWDEFRTTQTDLIRSLGLTIFSDFNGRRCGVKDWDPEVYAGVVDRLDDFFVWNDLHWRLDKVELLQRAEEWNEALEKYCDDMGLTGAEREAVVLKHTASLCAPCSNPACNKWETKAKEFKSCSACKAVAYCCRDCQKKDWKAQHKATCVVT